MTPPKTNPIATDPIHARTYQQVADELARRYGIRIKLQNVAKACAKAERKIAAALAAEGWTL